MTAGDEPAFESFFDRYFPGLYRFALSRLRHDGDAAEEVAQAALAKAMTKLSTYRGEAALFTWLCTFCRHEISAYCKRRGREQPVDLTEDSPEVRAALDLLAHGKPNPEELVHQKEVARLVQTTLDHLPRRYGDALEWKYVHGLSVVEIAEKLGCGVKAAESVLTRARDAFRDGFGAVSGVSS
jgi:RNA polymerase sigma-70 factor, ECF subfamily